MAYAQQVIVSRRGRRDILGNTLVTGLLSAGANVLVPGSGTVVAAGLGSGLLGRVFGGGSRDAWRQERVLWVLSAAQRGSTTAAGLILAAPNEVSGNEKGMWQEAAAGIPQAVLAISRPWWPVGQPEFYQNPASPTYQAIMRETAQAQMASSVSPTVSPLLVNNGFPVLPSDVHPTVNTSSMLPMMTTTAGFNYVPWVIGGGIAFFLLSRKR